MSNETIKYCIDANVLIQAWQKYYSPRLCPTYWDILNRLGSANVIFLPETVAEEITRTEDDLAEWLRSSSIPIDPISLGVTQQLQRIYQSNPTHRNLVDNVRGRSLGDPWVIAHALHHSATVVTKEDKITAVNSTKVKIPNVCENMGVRWMNDFDLLNELIVQFTCSSLMY